MHKVYFKPFVDDLESIVLVAEFPDAVQACEFALALHRASNIPHRVTVEDPDFKECLILSASKNV